MPLSQRHCVPFPRVVTSWGYQFPPRCACSRAPRPSRYPTVAAPTHRFSLSLFTITGGREREKERERGGSPCIFPPFFLPSSAYDPPLSPYHVPLPFALRGTLPSTHLPPPVAPQSCFISRLWPPFSPHFVLRFSLRSRRAPFPCSSPFFLSRRVTLSVSLFRSAIFFL